MESVDDMKGWTDKEKALIKELRLEQLVTEDYLRKLYKKHKEFFDNSESHPLSWIKAMIIGNEVLKDLDKLGQGVGNTLERYYNKGISPGANAMAAWQGAFFYVMHQLAEIGLIPKPKE